MRRIILVASLAAVICTLSAITASTASACVVQFGICAPAADNAPGGGSYHNRAPSAQFITDVPLNDGTQKASGRSPAFCGQGN